MLFGRTCTLCLGTGEIEQPAADPCDAVRREERAAARAVLDEIQICIDRARARLR